MALRYCSIIHTVTLVIAVVGRPACIPSAMYLFLLLVSLQGSCVSWSSSGLILSAATSSAAAATFLVVSVTSVAAESVAPFPALWWPDFLVLAVSLGMLLIVARIRLVTVAPSGHADATVSRFDSTAEGSTSIVATCLLAIACALQPCFIALPLLLLVLCILHSWGWGIAAPQLIHRTQVLFKVAQVYGALWLAATMREADFIIAVLRANELIDLETVDAIKAQFGLITRRVRDSHGVISPEVVYKHLVQQGRVLPREAHQEEAISLEEAISQGTIRPDADDRFATVYVNMRVKDEGFAEWHEHYWLPSVVNSPDGDLPPPHAHNDVVAGEDSTPPANEGRSGWAGNGPYQRLLDA